MASANVEISIFKIKEKRLKAIHYYDLRDINGLNFFDLLIDKFVGFCSEKQIDEKEERTYPFAFDDQGRSMIKINKEKGIFSGILEAGEFGKTRKIAEINRENGEVSLEYKGNISIDNTVLDPFFFMLVVPPRKSNTLFILTEKKGTRSISNRIRNLLIQFFNYYFTNDNEVKLKCEIKPYIDDEVAKHYLNEGVYKSITFSRSSLPADISARYHLGNFYNKDFEIQLTIKAKRGRAISLLAKNKILDIVSQNPDGFFTYPAFNEIGFDNRETRISVRSDLGGVPKKINIENQKVRSSYELDVTLNAANNFNFESLYDESILLLNGLNLDLFN
ncbi:hypothetical protein LX69_01095 [Breznakibacter xylanolyticus]|uniref:Uncharacterized protein n=1 Tax=Breznakibacter xylanolyticus TaxID=990 RepID=A0A2W7Q8I3_9BACT|nr:hypothetical protein [Breznakibacter xylanolyticus]PZX18059.1 hypothetical protein LX69_01095 [Breznakibacter xylanolyticus]